MVTNAILNVLKSRIGQLAVVGIVGLGAGVGLHKRFASPTFTTSIVHDVTQVKVDNPILTEKIIDRIIIDPKQQQAIASLVKENNALKLKLTQISNTVATNETTGSGTPTEVVRGTPTEGGQVQGTPTVPTYSFKDYQLDATYSKEAFNYKLSQTFLVETSSGRDSEGKAVGIVRLFQDTPKGLIPIEAKTTVIVADPNPSKWWVSPRLQGGINFAEDKTRSGFIGLQLLKHGTSRDPKDLKYSVGTIGVRLGNSTIEPSLIPINFNVGNARFSPFSNLWIGPSFNLKKQVGLTISATF